VNAAGVTVLRKKLRRKEMVAFFEKLAPTVIGIGTAWRLGVRAPRR
jgi:transposase